MAKCIFSDSCVHLQEKHKHFDHTNEESCRLIHTHHSAATLWQIICKKSIVHNLFKIESHCHYDDVARLLNVLCNQEKL